VNHHDGERRGLEGMADDHGAGRGTGVRRTQPHAAATVVETLRRATDFI
jgi:hypothetical protein